MDIQFYTMEALRTPAGLSAAVWLLTQLLKGLTDRVISISTRYVALIIAWALMLSVAAIDGNLNATSVLLSILNGAVVATAASGGHDLIVNGVANVKRKP